MTHQKQEDKKLLESWEAEYRAGFSWTGVKYQRAFELLVPLVNQLLAAQARISFREGVEAERERTKRLGAVYLTKICWTEAEKKSFYEFINNPDHEEKQ